MRYKVGDEVMLHHVSGVEMDEAIAKACVPGGVEAQYSNDFLRNTHPKGVKGRIISVRNPFISASPYNVELAVVYLHHCTLYVNETTIHPISNKKQLNLEVMV